MAIGLFKSGKSTRTVAKEMGCGKRSVERLRKKVKEVGLAKGVLDNPALWRPRKVHHPHILPHQGVPFLSAAQLKEKAKPQLDHLDVRRIQEALLRAGYPSRSASKKPLLTPKMREKRMAWC